MKYDKLKTISTQFVADDGKAVYSITQTIISFMVGFYICMHSPCIGYVFLGLSLCRAFTQFHDMAHGSFFRTQRYNEIFGRIFDKFMFISYEYWRKGHNYHHNVFGNLDKYDTSQTILFTKQEYAEYGIIKKMFVRVFREPIVFHLFTVHILWYIGTPFINLVKRKYVDVIQHVVCVFVFYCVYVHTGISWFHVHYITLTIGVGLFHLQHSCNAPYRKHVSGGYDKHDAAIQGSTFLQIHPLLKFFTLGIEYHHIHHFSTRVPCYKLELMHNHVGDSVWESEYKVNYVGFCKGAISMFNVQLDTNDGLLYSFSYLW